LREKGPLYKLTTNACSAWALPQPRSASPRATLEAAIELCPQQAAAGQGAMRRTRRAGPDRAPPSDLARRARLLYTTRPGLARPSRGEPVTEAHRIALRIATTWTIHQSASVVDTAITWRARTAVVAGKPVSSGRFRDMHAIAQQIQARDTHYEDAGKVIFRQAQPPVDDR